MTKRKEKNVVEKNQENQDEEKRSTNEFRGNKDNGITILFFIVGLIIVTSMIRVINKVWIKIES